MIQYVFDDEEYLRIFAEDQCWDKETLNQLKEEYNIFFMNGGDGVSPVMIKNNMAFIGWEDDGQIGFRKVNIIMEVFWTDLIFIGLNF